VAWRVAYQRPSVRVRLLLYGAGPFLLLGTLIVLYYGPWPALRRLVSPEAEWIPPDLRSEFGLLESLQNVVLLAIAGVALAGARRAQSGWERIAAWALVVGAVAMLLEETDYLTQYAYLFRDGGAEETPRNLHRLGYAQIVQDNLVRLGLSTLFGAFAIVFANHRNAVLAYLAPDRFVVLTLLLTTALQEFVWWHSARVPLDHGSLAGNEIEFYDLGNYLVVLLWAIDLTRWRRLEPA